MSFIRKYWVIVGAVVCMLLDRHFGPVEGAQDAVYGWIGAVIGAVTSLAGGIAGSVSANNRLKKANKMMDQKQRRLEAWRNAEMNSDFLDRADSRAALRRVSEYNKEAQKADDTNAIKRGMTDEAKVAKAARLNRGYADVVSQVAAVGAQHKDRVQQQYMAEIGNLENMRISQQMDTSGASNLAAGIAGAGSALGGAIDGIGGSKGTKAGGVGTYAASTAQVRDMSKKGTGVPDLFEQSRYKINL